MRKCLHGSALSSCIYFDKIRRVDSLFLTELIINLSKSLYSSVSKTIETDDDWFQTPAFS